MRCSECKSKLPKQVVKIAKGLGVKKVLGYCCGTKINFLLTGRSKFLAAVIRINKKHRKTFKKLRG